MDPIWLGAGAAAVLVIILGVFWWRRLQRRRLLGELALLPAQVHNPRQFLGLKRIRVWQLEVSQPMRACQWARESCGHRFRAEVAIPLPIAGCGTRCTCHYSPITENRKHKRRRDPLDQAAIDFDAEASDRRHRDGRRKEDHWHQGQK